MKVLKGFGLGILSFLLFLSLTIFGLALIPNYTVLNPRFVTGQIDRLDISGLVQQAMQERGGGGAPDGIPKEVRDTLADTLRKVEPELKAQVRAAINSIYDYLLGEKLDLKLAAVLGDTVLSRPFVVSVINQVPVAPLAKAALAPKLRERIPPGVPLDADELSRRIDSAIVRLEPTLKQQTTAAAGPILDYLLGKSQTLRVVVDLGPVLASVREDLISLYLATAPPEVLLLPRPLQEQAFNMLWSQIAASAPAAFVIDEKLIGPEVPANIARGLAQAETRLAEVKQYVGYFQAGFRALLAFILVLVLAIIAIHHQVRGAARGLGILFTTYGAVEFAGILIIKGVAAAKVTGLPPQLQPMVPGLVNDVFAPLQNFSLALLIAGVALIVLSILYRPRPASTR